MPAKCLMLQGTASDAGKSLLVTGLCRILVQDGYRVAPFKSQNMTPETYITPDNLEIGRSQGIQAEAAGLSATADMNPILLKPRETALTRVIVRGKPLTDMSARTYGEDYLPRALAMVGTAFNRLRALYDVIVLEGAGSPVEMNLKDRDIVNMKMAELAGAPVILVADIDRGGVFAALVGTMELFTPAERKRVAGFIINRFRGESALFNPGLDFLKQRTGRPSLGVVPFIPDLGIYAGGFTIPRNQAGTQQARSNPPPLSANDAPSLRQQRQQSYDHLAEILRRHLDMKQIYRIIGLG